MAKSVSVKLRYSLYLFIFIIHHNVIAKDTKNINIDDLVKNYKEIIQAEEKNKQEKDDVNIITKRINFLQQKRIQNKEELFANKDKLKAYLTYKEQITKSLYMSSRSYALPIINQYNIDKEKQIVVNKDLYNIIIKHITQQELYNQKIKTLIKELELLKGLPADILTNEKQRIEQLDSQIEQLKRIIPTSINTQNSSNPQTITLNPDTHHPTIHLIVKDRSLIIQYRSKL